MLYFFSCINCTCTTSRSRTVELHGEIRGVNPKQTPGTAISGSCLSEGLATAHLSDGLPTQMFAGPGLVSARTSKHRLWAPKTPASVGTRRASVKCHPRGPAKQGKPRDEARRDTAESTRYPMPCEPALSPVLPRLLGPDKVSFRAELLLGWAHIANGTGQQFDKHSVLWERCYQVVS